MTTRRSLAQRRVPIVASGIAVCAALLTGCDSTVDGHAIAADPVIGASPTTTPGATGTLAPSASPTPSPSSSPTASSSTPGSAPGDLDRVLPQPADFPGGYTADVLPHDQAVDAAGDLSGVHTGAKVSPSRCASPLPADPADLSMITGTNGASGTVLAVVVTRSSGSLDSIENGLKNCRKFTSNDQGAVSAITRTATHAVNAKDIGADATVAYTQTVHSGAAGVGLTQRSVTEVAQVGDVRITATSMAHGPRDLDRAGVDEVLATAVRNARGQ